MSRFPEQLAVTRRFTLGVPRGFTFAGDRLLFLRSSSGRDPVNLLWELDLDTGEERCLVDPREVTLDAELPSAERVRRERARELAEGITSFATDDDGQVVAFALHGRLCTLDDGALRVHEAAGVFDPRPSPDGSAVAFVAGSALHLLEAATASRRVLVEEAEVSWGIAEFIAAEEMGRDRGFWWSPDATRLAVARVDERPVERWHLSDPTRPWRAPNVIRYPAAGTSNADVALFVVGLDGSRCEVPWDRDAFPYLTRVSWTREGLVLQLQTRDQRTLAVLVADDEGSTTTLRQVTDTTGIELVAGSPAWWNGQLVTVEDHVDHGSGGTRAICVDGEVVTRPGLQVRGIVATDETSVTFTASEDPMQVHVYRFDADGTTQLTRDPGVHGAVVGDARTLIVSSTDAGVRARVGDLEIAQCAETPVITPRPRFLELAGLRAALLLPSGEGPFPVLLDPYGGPHAQRVVRSRNALLTSQWFADQGFAVLIVDGRGTPGRGPVFERAVHGDLAGPALADQLAGLDAAGEVEPRLDLERVGIRGWSFGGYLAALAALRAPDRIRAAVVGAPVIDWRLYDTHYTERYLGHPDEAPDAYAASNALDEASDSSTNVDSPPRMLIIHGLADDNVVAAHSLRLSSALHARGWPHELVLLSEATHMASEERVTRRLLEQQAAFLADALG